MNNEQIKDYLLVAGVFTLGAMILDFIKLILECI